MVAANSRTQTLQYLLAQGKEWGLKEFENYEWDSGNDWKLSASLTTKQKGHEIKDREAKEVSHERSHLTVGGWMEDPHQIPRKMAAEPKESSGSG